MAPQPGYNIHESNNRWSLFGHLLLHKVAIPGCCRWPTIGGHFFGTCCCTGLLFRVAVIDPQSVVSFFGTTLFQTRIRVWNFEMSFMDFDRRLIGKYIPIGALSLWSPHDFYDVLSKTRAVSENQIQENKKCDASEVHMPYDRKHNNAIISVNEFQMWRKERRRQKKNDWSRMDNPFRHICDLQTAHPRQQQNVVNEWIDWNQYFVTVFGGCPPAYISK